MQSPPISMTNIEGPHGGSVGLQLHRGHFFVSTSNETALALNSTHPDGTQMLIGGANEQQVPFMLRAKYPGVGPASLTISASNAPENLAFTYYANGDVFYANMPTNGTNGGNGGSGGNGSSGQLQGIVTQTMNSTQKVTALSPYYPISASGIYNVGFRIELQNPAFSADMLIGDFVTTVTGANGLRGYQRTTRWINAAQAVGDLVTENVKTETTAVMVSVCETVKESSTRIRAYVRASLSAANCIAAMRCEIVAPQHLSMVLTPFCEATV